MRRKVDSSAPSNRFPAGFTLVEVLVVIALIGILLALTLPAIQQVRESARRSQCKNNLRQVALACTSFEAARGVYPPGQMFAQYGYGPDSTAWSFFAQILPYLDQESLYVKGGVPFKTLRQSEIAMTTIPVLLCPSDSSGATGPRFDAGNMVEYGFGVGPTNFKGVSGANWGADGTQGWGPDDSGTLWPSRGTNGSYDGLNDGDGMFYRVDYKVHRRARDVRDGLSNTFIVGEALPRDDVYCSWPYANNAYSTCAIPPNSKGVSSPEFWPNSQSFRSDHPGGLHFAFGDGSVRFIGESIDLQVYRGLATIAGAETVNPP